MDFPQNRAHLENREIFRLRSKLALVTSFPFFPLQVCAKVLTVADMGPFKNVRCDWHAVK
jgi:hypothetical protein